MYQSTSFIDRSGAIQQNQNLSFRPSMKNSNKKISFNQNVRVRPICERSSEMTAEEKSQIYYSKDEMMQFRQDCMKICKNAITQARSLSIINPAVSPEKNLSLILATNDSMRGFEAQVCPTRKRNRAMVNQAVNLYHKQLKALSMMTPQQRETALADAYAKLNCFSQMLASSIAQKDMTEAYEKDAKCSTEFVTISPAPSTPTFQPYSVPNVVSPVAETKRSVDFVTEQRREKRRRLN